MESNAHRRSLGMKALDPTISAETQPIVPALPTLTVGRGKKRLKPAVEARKKGSKRSANECVNTFVDI